jgi:hypothetical protein
VTPRPRDSAQIERQIEANDADYDPDRDCDPWPMLRRKGKIASIEALGGEVNVAANAENDEAEKPEPDWAEKWAKVERIARNVLREKELIILGARMELNEQEQPLWTYAELANLCGLSA